MPVRFAAPEDAVRVIQSGHRVFVQGAAATPRALLRGLLAHAGRLRDVELIHLHLDDPCAYARPEYAAAFRSASLFVGPAMRRNLDGDRVDYLPCFLSEIPSLFRSKRRPLDVALVHVSPPDRHGLCSLGTSVDIARAAIDSASTIIAQVNPHMPRVHGDGVFPYARIDYAVEVDEPLPEHQPPELTEVERAIGRHVATLVEDGSTLQMGIGAIPDAVLGALTHHKHLGVHTEMWTDGLLPLLDSGVVDNSRKATHVGKTVSGFVVGTRAVYDFLDDNPNAIQLDIGYVNSAAVIARNPKVVAINSAVEVDLTGQVCADSIGHRIISGVGGQMDFIRGASLSQGGKPIIALPSRTKEGTARLVATLRPGAGVVTTRAHVHFVATEYGVADLYGRTLSERATALIALAHPDDREGLAAAWHAVRRESG